MKFKLQDDIVSNVEQSLYGTSDDSDEIRHGLHDGVTTHYVSGRPNVS